MPIARTQSKTEHRFVRVTGPIRQSRGGTLTLEVRRFTVAPDQFGAFEDDEAYHRALHRLNQRGRSSVPDSEPPASPKNLTATLSSGFAVLNWQDNEESDFGSYNIFRSTTPDTGYIQVAAGIVPSAYRCWIGEGQTPYYFVVTATDYSGNQSGFSNKVRVGTARVP